MKRTVRFCLQCHTQGTCAGVLQQMLDMVRAGHWRCLYNKPQCGTVVAGEPPKHKPRKRGRP